MVSLRALSIQTLPIIQEFHLSIDLSYSFGNKLVLEPMGPRTSRAWIWIQFFFHRLDLDGTFFLSPNLALDFVEPCYKLI